MVLHVSRDINSGAPKKTDIQFAAMASWQNQVTIIVVNWNSGTLLSECLLRLSQQTFPLVRILVMANGSTDGSAERVRQMPEATVRFLGANLGFAAANNRALDECDTEFIALLNPDAFPDSGWLKRLVDAARAHPDVVAFGSRQMMHGVPDLIDPLILRAFSRQFDAIVDPKNVRCGTGRLIEA